MSMTLDVSKLSGWLNAAAPCQGRRREHTITGGKMRAGKAVGFGGDGRLGGDGSK